MTQGAQFGVLREQIASHLRPTRASILTNTRSQFFSLTSQGAAPRGLRGRGTRLSTSYAAAGTERRLSAFWARICGKNLRGAAMDDHRLLPVDWRRDACGCAAESAAIPLTGAAIPVPRSRGGADASCKARPQKGGAKTRAVGWGSGCTWPADRATARR